MRRGNMGHLTRIANAVVQNLEQGPVQTHISEVIRGEPTTFLFLCPLPSVPSSENYTDMEQTMQPSLSSSQCKLSDLFMEQAL